jgi:hypothetical protein
LHGYNIKKIGPDFDNQVLLFNQKFTSNLQRSGKPQSVWALILAIPVLPLNNPLLQMDNGDGNDSPLAGQWGWGFHPLASELFVDHVDWEQEPLPSTPVYMDASG